MFRAFIKASDEVKFNYKLTNEIEFHEAFAKFKNSLETSVLSVRRSLQGEEVNE